MPIKVLIVDDSIVFRNRLRKLINSDPALQVVDVATNGKDALEKVIALTPDVITMDVNMPIMDGIQTVRAIMELKPTPILMLSAVTAEAASATFEALEAGALDFLLKNQDIVAREITDYSADLITKIKALASCKLTNNKIDYKNVNYKNIVHKNVNKYEIILIGSSTGGPIALQTVLQEIPRQFSVPIIIVQHMPENFTKPFSERMNSICNLTVREAQHGDIITAGNVYIAPGGKQLAFKRLANNTTKIEIKESEASVYYRPCIDLAFMSASTVFKGKILTIILTGMGADGREGVRALKNIGCTSWAQDEKTSIVFGMPQAVISAGLADKVFALENIGKAIVEEIK